MSTDLLSLEHPSVLLFRLSHLFPLLCGAGSTVPREGFDSSVIMLFFLVWCGFDTSYIVSSIHIYTFVVSRAFMAGAASQAGDADSSRAPGLTSGFQGSMNVHLGALLLVPQWQCMFFSILQYALYENLSLSLFYGRREILKLDNCIYRNYNIQYTIQTRHQKLRWHNDFGPT